MHKSRVLLVDDEAGIRRALRKWFERNGWDVDEACDGAAACAHLDHVNTGYALIICDVHLPGVSGLEVATRVQHLWPELLARFVFSTGDDIHFGADYPTLRERTHVLLKPFEFSTLHTLVELISPSSEGVKSRPEMAQNQPAS